MEKEIEPAIESNRIKTEKFKMFTKITESIMPLDYYAPWYQNNIELSNRNCNFRHIDIKRFENNI